MTNREKLASMSDDDLAAWLCRQMWPDFDKPDVINMIRYHQVRNFLKMEAKEEND